jgi:mannose-6-phosphate isomerase
MEGGHIARVCCNAKTALLCRGKAPVADRALRRTGMSCFAGIGADIGGIRGVIVPIELSPRGLAKPWGVATLPPALAAHAAGDRTGEIWFEAAEGGFGNDALLVKMLFTAERLSVQVHPDDAGATTLGLPHGKDEAWYVMAAEPGASIGIGLAPGLDIAAVAAAARDGSIVDLMEWRRVAAGDVLYVPGGTVHALGGGLQLVEIQQALDLTWRLYDYGRPRELHLDAGLAAARLEPFGPNARARRVDAARSIRAEGGKFVIEEIAGPWCGRLSASAVRPAWVIGLAGNGELGGATVAAGKVWRVDSDAVVNLAPDGHWLVAYGAAGTAAGRLAA